MKCSYAFVVFAGLLFCFQHIGILCAQQNNQTDNPTIILTGTIERIPEGTYSTCIQGETHTITPENKLLRPDSSKIDLTGYEGSNVVIFGKEEIVECSVIRVNSIFKADNSVSGLIAGTVEKSIGQMSPRSIGTTSATLKKANDPLFNKSLLIEDNGVFFFDGLADGSYKLTFTTQETPSSQTNVEISITQDNPVQIYNIILPYEYTQVPIFDGTGLTLLSLFIPAVFFRKQERHNCRH